MNIENLKPFQKGDDPRRQNGRKEGSKNISTIVKELLDSDLDDISDPEIKKLIQKVNAKTAKEAIIYTVLKKSLGGDIKATEWLCSYLENVESQKEPGFFDANKIEIQIVEPKHQRPNDYSI